MSDKACRTDYVSWKDETPDEDHSYFFHSENSQAASSDNSEAEGHSKEYKGGLQHSSQKKAESMKQKSGVGIFSRLRKRLGSRLEQLPGKWTSSSVRVTSISSDVQVEGECTSMVHKKRAPLYRCVPTPPGCIPIEVMTRVEDVFYSLPLNLPGQGERSTAIDGEKTSIDDDRNRNENVQENASLSPNAQMCKVDRPTKLLINNWIDLEQGW